MLLLCTLATLGDLHAQATDTVSAPPRPTVSAPQHLSAPPLVRTGKWLALAGAVVLGYTADQKHRSADRAYSELRLRCFDLPDSCIVGPGNKYIDPTSEALYQDTRSFDHQATRLLITAEVALAGAAAGFLWELMHHRDRPPTIPFEPHVAPAASATNIGLTLHF